jgi:P27 family predicted phage terminase small subunit
VLKLRGTDRRHRGAGEPRPDPSVPPCPDWLDDQAKQAWAQVVPPLAAAGMLSVVDGNALARYVTYWGRWRAAQAFLAKHGAVYPVKDEAGHVKCLVQVPQVAIAAKLGALLARLEQEFGMTPSARTRIRAAPSDGDEAEDDPLQEFMRIAP